MRARSSGIPSIERLGSTKGDGRLDSSRDAGSRTPAAAARAAVANLHVARAMRASSPPRGPGGRFYRPELDGLRFFAFLAVYINHTLLLDPGRGEWWKR